MMKLKLHWKLTWIFCSAVIAGLLAGYFYLTAHLKTYLEKNLSNNLKHQLLLTKSFLETNWLDKADLAEANRLAHHIGEDLGLRATIMRMDGQVIGDTDLTDAELLQLENHGSRPEVREAVQTGYGTSKRFSYTLKRYLLYVAIPFGQAQAVGILRFAIPLSEIEMLETKLRQIVIVALGLVFLLSLGFTFLIARFVSRPLTQMIKIAQAMSLGDFSVKPSIRSDDEIGDLAKALTRMSDDIKDKITAIRQESARLDAVLSSMLEGVIVTDARYTVILMNPSIRKLFLIDGNPEARGLFEVVRDAGVQNIADRILKSREALVSAEIFIPHGEGKTLRVNAAAVLRNGVLEGAVLVFHDITELRRLEKIRQDFVANVSHELRTPISSIKGYAETLLDGAIEDKNNARDFIQIIYQDSERLARLIADLLDLSKIESGKMNMVLMPIDLKPIIQRTIGVLKKSIAQKQLAVDLNIPVDLPKVKADEGRLAQVFLNLLDNAVKFTPEGGALKISARIYEKYAQVDIADTGIGIAPEDLPRIFERFYRVDKAHSRELGGTGLGLSIVKHIILAHEGQVWVESQPGRGTIFSFTLPIV
ncbi:MAG: HAMP domain-containing protein [Candidatus Omnitrophica bacterium]|nr:HAMP domain-containing protein [Candidatus Omnitrophota bacterium]